MKSRGKGFGVTSSAQGQEGPDGQRGMNESYGGNGSKGLNGQKEPTQLSQPIGSACGRDSKDSSSAPEIAPERFDAVLFDMDGVVTRTATVHFAAWQSTFDELLKKLDGADAKLFTESDYLAYVDGKPREDGVSSFLAARNIKLPKGAGTDKPGTETMVAVAKKKDQEFMHLVHTKGVEAYETTISLIRALRSAGVKTALVTASKNGAEILKVTRTAPLFDATVTGVDAAELHLKGKPAPDVFLEAAKRLGVPAEKAVVVEDAEAGVESGRNGKFGMVIGVARNNNKDALKKHGADVVVCDLAEVKVNDQSNSYQLGTALADMNVTDANWVLSYDHYDPQKQGQRESLCALGNGKWFVRGAASEAIADDIHYPATYVAGGYDSVRVDVEELHQEGDPPLDIEELVNMPNGMFQGFKINDGDWFSLDNVEIKEYSQRLDLREAILYRTVVFRDREGRETKTTERRFVHMRYSHMAGIETCVTALNWSGKLRLRSGIDARVRNGNDTIDPRCQNNKHLQTLERSGNDHIYLKAITNDSRLVVSQAARIEVHSTDKNCAINKHNIVEDEFVAQEYELDLHQDETLSLQKILALFTSRDKGIYETGSAALEAVQDAPNFDELVKCHTKAWKSLWEQFDIFIETTEDYSKLVPSLLLHLNSFHAMQAASPHTVDLDVGIPARSWTGEGYQGHIFWDDLFVFPFINMRLPNITSALLKYRYRRIGEARKIAKNFGAKGACFPWQSASNGKERTPNYWWQPINQKWVRDYTHLEIHVNGAIAYNVWQYYQVTGDTAFMYVYGSEIIMEIARFFATFAKFNDERKRYEILGVIGPDEFHNGYPNFKTPGVNNNAYTNIMAAWTLQRALELLETLPKDHSEHIRRRLNIDDEELKLWRHVSTKMFVPIMSNGIIEQFEGYEDLEEFPVYKNARLDKEAIDASLKDNFGYLNQYKIGKQADVLILGYLFSEQELDELMNILGYPNECLSFERLAKYYIPRTSNNSTLSRVPHAWVLSRLDRMRSSQSLSSTLSLSPAQGQNGGQVQPPEGDLDPEAADSVEVFYRALGSDYYDVVSRGTTNSGIHMAAMAGTVDIVQRCYTGIVTRDEVLWFDPVLPKALIRLSFTARYRGQSLRIDINHEHLKVHARHMSANEISIGFGEEIFKLKAGDTKIIELRSGKNSSDNNRNGK
jgi:beta-phosphoglucomutase family hydrolase